MLKPTNRTFSMMTCSLLACLLPSLSAQAQSVNLVGMFQTPNTQTHSETISQLEQDANSQDCHLLREGKTLGAQGSYALQPHDSFFVLKCSQALLNQTRAQPLIEHLNQNTNNLILLEGKDNQRSGGNLTANGTQRSYIFKLSNYNNRSPKQRDVDLMQLTTGSKKPKYHYVTEASIRIDEAYGMERPDKLTIMYYQSADDGKKFRHNNPDLMKKIGQFNQDHLTQFSYISAQSNR